MEALNVLLCIITTSTPFPCTTTIYFGPLPTPVPGTTPFVNYPAFPPLVLLLCASSSSIPRPSVPNLPGSSNAEWLEGLLHCGFPGALTRRLLAEPDLLDYELKGEVDTMEDGSSSEIPAQREIMEWEEDERVMKLFYKLVAHTGFIPVTDPAQDKEANDDQYQVPINGDGDVESTPAPSFTLNQISEHVGDHVMFDKTPSDNSDDASSLSPSKHPSAVEQFASARRMARRIVYDLRFLKPERYFGPFIAPISNDEANKGGSTSKGGSMTSRLLTVDDAGEENTEYSYSDIHSDSDAGEDDTSENESDILFPIVHLINMLPNADATPGPRLAGNGQPISLHSLKPDWVWLAAARIIVEANLRDMLERAPNLNADANGAESDRRVLEEVGNALRRIEGLRMGGAPGFWRDWGVMDSSANSDAGNEVDVKGKCKMQESGEGTEQGWDWAGVEGTWR